MDSAAKDTASTRLCPGGSASQKHSPMASSGNSAWRMLNNAAAGRRPEPAEPEARTHRHQPQRQRGQAEALQRGGDRLREVQPGQVGQQAGHAWPGSAGCARSPAGSRGRRAAPAAHRGDVAQRHAQRDEQRPRPDPCGPARRSASASAMKELKRKAVCAPEACSCRVDAGQQAQRRPATRRWRPPYSSQAQAQRRAGLQRRWRIELNSSTRAAGDTPAADAVPRCGSARCSGRAQKPQDQQGSRGTSSSVRHAASVPARWPSSNIAPASPSDESERRSAVHPASGHSDIDLRRFFAEHPHASCRASCPASAKSKLMACPRRWSRLDGLATPISPRRPPARPGAAVAFAP